MTDEQAECVAPRWIDVLGADRLADEGISPEELSTNKAPGGGIDIDESDAEGLVDAMEGCEIDLTDYAIASLTARRALTPDEETCLRGVFDPEGAHVALVAAFLQDEGAAGSVLDDAKACVGNDD